MCFGVRPERSPFVNDMSTAIQTPAAEQANILAANLAALQRQMAETQTQLIPATDQDPSSSAFSPSEGEKEKRSGVLFWLTI